MFLKQFVYINWGNIPNLEFDFGPVNLFSGGNGSGKTTAADAIQTVMTAAHENLFQYNPGQDETTQRGRGGKRVRTLASYVLGCDDGSYARLDPTDGYLAAVFHPTQGESGEPFTAVIAARAWLDTVGSNRMARQDDAQFFIINGEQLGLNHFVRQDSAGRYVVPLPELPTLLISEFGKRRVEKYETKKAYLRRLYGALRGKSDAVTETEAIAAARAFSRFMSYKPIKGINRFVADEILEQKDLGEAVRSVSSQLKTIHHMERDAANLLTSMETLRRAGEQAQHYIEQWSSLNLLDYTLAQAEYQTRQADYLRGKQLQQTRSQIQRETEQEIAQLERQAELVHDQRINLEAQRQGVQSLRQKDELEKQRNQLDARLVQQTQSVLAEDQWVAENIQASQEIAESLDDATLLDGQSGITSLEAQALAREVSGTARQVVRELHHLVQRDFSGAMPALVAELEQVQSLQQAHNRWHSFWHGGEADEPPREQLAAQLHGHRARYQQLTEQRRQKQLEIERLNADQVNYPAYVERALRAIRQHCPAADPRVLCDHVEVKDPRWQSAIEGYLGGARFSILVEADFEAEAIGIVRGLSGRDNRARVIQGAKAASDAARTSLDPQSIIHVLAFSHAVARAYLTASFGTVVRVDSAEALRMTRRGITEEGIGSGGYSMWRCDLPDSDLVFGAAARERALQAKLLELSGVEVEWHQANDRLQQISRLLQAVDRLRVVRYADDLYAIVETHREIGQVDGLLDQLDLTEHQDLESRLQTLKAEQLELATKKGGLHEKLGEIRSSLESIDKQLKALSDLQEQNRERLDKCEAALQELAATWPDFDVEARLQVADGEARDLDITIARNYRHELEKELQLAQRRAEDEVKAHNQHCRPVDTIIYPDFTGEYDAALFRAICQLQRELDRVYNILKNNILVEKHQQLNELKGAFNNAFVTHLCHTIHQALNDGKRQIEQLNRELQHHRFGADRETFRFDSDWIPEYRDYARFFQEVVKNPLLGDEATLFEVELSEKSRKVLNDLMAMLLDEDEQRAMRDLERIADYRNYRRYEIYKEVEGKPPIPLSEYGTGSGGQLETPAYIIRSAAITSAFRFAEGSTHLRMVLVDEAFSKMDETRSREVIDYLTGSLGLQLLFIMPTSKCGPYMDLISHEFVFAKVPSEALRGELRTRVLVDRKQCNQERIKTLWANHRRNVYHQAELDFMQEFAATEQ
ncbi:SbcC/MukB-like Walker B domain-containing protein [Sedimenticola selenatireducens]|uniref:ATP-binding protein n=2 Tax=Sedimenticola selenatireducens TaxID=191960 RepID=UPI002AAAC8EB|nr:SbcC/MukB-like Walker B domain-containing protein [Sedimenticola selenatireducens]